MGANELQNWIAYCALEDEKYRERIEKSVQLSNQSKETDSAKSNAMRNFLTKLGN